MPGHHAGLHQRGQHRAFRVGQDHPGLGRDLPEEAAEAGQGAAGTHAHHHRIDVAVQLLPDLRARALFVGGRIGRVLELVDEHRVRGLPGQGFGDVLVVVRMALVHVRAGQPHLDPQRPQVQDLLPRHLVGHHQDQPVALGHRDLGQAQAGVPGGGLDDRSAGLEGAGRLGRFDHRQRDAVLDRAAGVLVLQLDEQPARPGLQRRQLQHRGRPDQVQGRAHRRRRQGLVHVAGPAVPGSRSPPKLQRAEWRCEA